MARSDADETDGGGLSLTKTALAVGLVIALFGWGAAAADYARDTQGWAAVDPPPEDGVGGRRARRSLAVRSLVTALWRFGTNAAIQVPRAPWVLGHSLKNQPWVAAVVVVLELGVIGGALLFRKLEADLSGPPASVRRDRRRDRPVRRDRPRKRKRRPPPGYG